MVGINTGFYWISFSLTHIIGFICLFKFIQTRRNSFMKFNFYQVTFVNQKILWQLWSYFFVVVLIWYKISVLLAQNQSPQVKVIEKQHVSIFKAFLTAVCLSFLDSFHRSPQKEPLLYLNLLLWTLCTFHMHCKGHVVE